MTNEQLVARIQAGEDEAGNMLTLWQQNKGFVAMFARKYSGQAEFDDLMQEGYIGLCKAVQSYDPERGFSFISYAAFPVRQTMQNYIINCCRTIRIRAEVDKELYEYKKFLNEFRKYYGREPSELEIRAFLRLDREDVERLRKIENTRQIGSLDTPVTGAEDITLSELVASDQDLEEEVIERLDREQAYKSLWESVDALPEKEKAVIRMRYGSGKTRKETAQALDVSLNTSLKYEHRAMGKLRRQQSRQWYRYYEPKSLRASHIRHVGVRSFQRTWTSEVERDAMRHIDRS